MKSHNNHPSLRIILLFSMMLCGISLTNAQISIVVSKSSSHTMSKDDLKEVFSGNKTSWSDGAKIQLIDQVETETSTTFYDKFIGKTASKIRLQWTKLVLSGAALAPKRAGDDDAVKKSVSGDQNAVGYISSGSLDATVKEIAKIQ